jgi:hypothetical protein
MEEVRNEVRSLRNDIASLAKDVAELKRMVGGAYSRGVSSQTPISAACSRSPFQTHSRMPDGTCSCESLQPRPTPRPWAAQG